ncbi:MAG TPA: hypothetical protein VGS19_01150 [Streptosporangiaceae bacterium]|nr:hypothetical protein [Streptosporangiaceae bacterium]
MPSRTTTSTLTWEAPPTATRSTNGDPDRFKAEANQLRARPGNWAVLTSVETGSQAYRLKKSISEGKLAAFAPAGSFEVRSAKNGDGIKVYCRFVKAEAEPQAK